MKGGGGQFRVFQVGKRKRVGAVRLVFMIAIGLVIAAAMKIVGVLLIVSMLVIPAATTRQLAVGLIFRGQAV